MEKKDPFLSLLEDALGRLTLKFKTEFKYEISKSTLGQAFTIFQETNPIFHKEIPDTNDLEQLHYQIVREFVTSGVERILMQKENEKRLFPKSHAKVKDNPIHKTKGTW